jgi:hypothetical protein
MYGLDITADLNDEDGTGYVWTFLDEARDPEKIKLGALLVAGGEDTAAMCEVIDFASAAPMGPALSFRFYRAPSDACVPRVCLPPPPDLAAFPTDLPPDRAARTRRQVLD